MSLQVENMEKNMAKLTIEVSAEELEKALQSAYQKQKGKITMPGFRKGKVPRQMIEKMYGVEVFYEDAANALISKNYAKAYDECGLDIVSQPSIDVVQIEKGKPFIFTAEVAVKPEVTLGEYKGLEVEKFSNRVTQKEIEEELVKEQEKSAREVIVEGRPVQDKDEVVLDFEGFVDGVAFEGGKGENYPLVIGSGSFIPGFEEQMIGMTKGETKDLNLTFPENYPAEELAGAAVVFKVTVHEIAKKVKAELNDEFIASLNIPEVTTVEDFRSYTRAYLEDQAERKFTTEKENAVLDLLIANCEVELDDEDIQKALESHISHIEMDVQSQGFTLDQYLQMMGMSREAFEDQLKEPAKQQAKFEAIIDEIIRVENIETTDEEVEAQAEAIANHNGIQKEDVLARIPADSFKRDINRVKASQVVLTTAKFIVE